MNLYHSRTESTMYQDSFECIIVDENTQESNNLRSEMYEFRSIRYESNRSVRHASQGTARQDCAEALAWARELQTFFTAHFYTCTPQVLSSLGESYACGGSMTENIDKVGGEGTGIFAKQVIDAYIQKL